LIIFYLRFFFIICIIKEEILYSINRFYLLISILFFFSLPPFGMFFLKFFIFESLNYTLGSTATLFSFFYIEILAKFKPQKKKN